MARNLADPSYEPSDEELQELSHAAFAEVPARNAAALEQLRAEIKVLGAVSLERVRALMGRAR
jgi:hypothetical protein